MGLTNVTVTIPESEVATLLRFAASLVEGDSPDEVIPDEDIEWEDEGASFGNGGTKWGFGKAAVRRAYMGGVSEVWRPMLEYMAEYPDEWVPFADICEAVDRVPAQMSGAVGAAERRLNKRPPYEKKYMGGVLHYRMPGAVAEVIEELAAEQADE